MNFLLRALCALTIAMLAGCAANPITGRDQFMMVSEEAAIKSSASAYSSMIGGFRKKDKVETGTPRAERASEITERLIAQAVRFRPDAAGWDWQLEVIQDPKVVNAFCMAGGKMGIYTGFWDKAGATDDELAAVMGHEIGHALASHTREKMSVGIGAQVGALVIAALASRNDPNAFSRSNDALQGAAALAVTLPNSREAENEADQIGIELAARAGFDPRGAVALWVKMAKMGGGGPPEFLSTHPSNTTRVARLSELAAKVDPLYQAAKSRAPEEGIPGFLGAEYVQIGHTGPTRAEYAARVAAQADTMTFVSGSFDQFRKGEVVLECRLACAIGYNSNRSAWKKLHETKQWRDLAISVARVGYLSDLSYYFLAEAANGLAFGEAAKQYYAKALQAGKEGHGCAGMFDTCEGIEVQRLAGAGVKR